MVTPVSVAGATARALAPFVVDVDVAVETAEGLLVLTDFPDCFSVVLDFAACCFDAATGFFVAGTGFTVFAGFEGTAFAALFATGFAVDLAHRPELSALAGKFLHWKDAYRPPAGLEHPGLAEMPYLGPGFEFTPAAGAPDTISNIYCFSYPAVLSHGKITSGVPSIGEGATRMAQTIARSLFVEDRALHFETFARYSAPELLGDEWIDADEKVLIE